MFEIDKDGKGISEVPDTTLTELGFDERNHLQEWIAGNPETLGEDLLILQKEYAGFDDTRERLDLLALDKEGQLVIIENKRDDTGRDVVWQAIKYAAYCSTLKQSQIIEIFQEYLNEQGEGGNAGDRICEFLDEDSIDEVALNSSGSKQRIMLVASNFRKEVTSAALWLIANEIGVQCVKFTPYKVDDRLLIDFTQIIPTPEATEYMISMSAKVKEEQDVREKETTRLQEKKERFWQQVLDYFSAQGFSLFNGVSPRKEVELSKGTAGDKLKYVMYYLEGKGVRINLVMKSADKDTNKAVFEFLEARKAKIEQRFSEHLGKPIELAWQRREDKQQSHIRYEYDGELSSYGEDNWQKMIEWLHQHMKGMEYAFRAALNEMKDKKIQSLVAQRRASREHASTP